MDRALAVAPSCDGPVRGMRATFRKLSRRCSVPLEWQVAVRMMPSVQVIQVIATRKRL